MLYGSTYVQYIRKYVRGTPAYPVHYTHRISKISTVGLHLHSAHSAPASYADGFISCANFFSGKYQVDIF